MNNSANLTGLREPRPQLPIPLPESVSVSVVEIPLACDMGREPEKLDAGAP